MFWNVATGEGECRGERKRSDAEGAGWIEWKRQKWECWVWTWWREAAREAVCGSLKHSGRMLSIEKNKQKKCQTQAGRVCPEYQEIEECCLPGTALHIILKPVPGALPRSRLLILISITVLIITIIISVIAWICKQPTLSIWSLGSRSGTQRWKHPAGLDAANSLCSLRKCRRSIGAVTSEVCFCIIPNSSEMSFSKSPILKGRTKAEWTQAAPFTPTLPLLFILLFLRLQQMFFLPDTILLICKRRVVSSIAAAAWLHCCFVLNEDAGGMFFHWRAQLLEDESVNEKDWILNCMDYLTGTTLTDIFKAFLMSVHIVIHLPWHDTANPGASVKRWLCGSVFLNNCIACFFQVWSHSLF